MLSTFFQTDLGPLLTSFLLGFTTFVLLAWYSCKKQTYWRKRGITYVKGIPFFGSMLEMTYKPIQEVDFQRTKKYGRVFGYYECNTPVLTVGDPEILRKIMVKDSHIFTSRRNLPAPDKITGKILTLTKGEEWKRIRTLVTPTFTTGKIKRMFNIFKECSQTLENNFKTAALNGEPASVKKLFGAFTMDVIANSAFSTKIDSHNDPDNPFAKNARGAFNRNINWRFILLVFFPSIVKMLKINVSNKKVFDFFTDVTLQIIEERKKTGQTRNDFLQLLMDTTEGLSENTADVNEKDDITENYGKTESDQVFKQNIYSKKTLSSDELIAQCLTFFLVGYDTTASTLSFVSYNLALYPNVQEKLIQEIDDALKENKGNLTYEVIQNMKYLDNVISETLRLFPPAVRVERAADEDYEIKELGLTVPKNMIIAIPIYSIHRDPEFYPDPEKFDPDRFTPEERARRNQYAFLPFGHGPRNCIGMRFALIEIKVCLAHVLSHFRFRRCSKTKVPLDFYTGQRLLQPKDIFLSVVCREDAVKTL